MSATREHTDRGGHLRLAGRAGAIAWGLCALTFALAATTFGLVVATPAASGGGVPLAVFEALAFTALAAVGALVASSQPRNAVGWLMCATPLLLVLGGLAETVFWREARGLAETSSSAAFALWVANWIWIPAVAPAITLIPLLFPTGSPPTPRWRVVAWIAAAGGIAVLTGFALTPGPLQNYSHVTNPVGVDGLKGALDLITGLGFLLLGIAALGSAASLARRFRRSHGVERQQLKWVAATAALAGIGWSVGVVIGTFLDSGNVDAGGKLDVGWVVLLLGLLAVAAAVAIAILRYRLYDIDVVINRTLVYGALTATLVLSYLATVLLLQLVLRPLTASSNLAIAGSTLAVAALFGPARRRIQEVVDRRFYRRKYDAAQTLARFGARLRDEVALDSLSAELRGVVAETMQPAHVSLWLRAPRGDAMTDRATKRVPVQAASGAQQS